MSIPYLVGLNKGEIVGQLVGLNDEQKIEELVSELLPKEWKGEVEWFAFINRMYEWIN